MLKVLILKTYLHQVETETRKSTESIINQKANKTKKREEEMLDHLLKGPEDTSLQFQDQLRTIVDMFS